MTLPLPAPVVTLRPGEKPSAARLAEIFAFIQEDLDTISLQLPVTPTTLAAMALPTEALPTTNLFKGRRILYVADKTNGVVWDLAYDGEGTLPWKYVGGPPLWSEVETAQSTTSTTYVNLTTVGPEVKTPLKGDYMVAHGCRAWNSNALQACWMSYSIGGTAAADADAVAVSTPVNNGTLMLMRSKRKTGLAASTALVGKYRSDAVTTANFANRWIELLPVRVG